MVLEPHVWCPFEIILGEGSYASRRSDSSLAYSGDGCAFFLAEIKSQIMYTIREVKLSYIKEHQLTPINNQAIKSSLTSAETFRTIWDDDLDMIERFYVLYLDNANKVQSVSMISMGGITGTVVDLRMVFATALKCLATSIIVAHNHPSGSLRPSAADLNLTKKIEEAGKVLDIALLDHIILTENSYYSFRDEGDL